MHELVALCPSNLAALPNNVSIPRYDRDQLSAGIVHIGVGNFHRAHQAWYLHRLFNEGLGNDWGIIGGGVREGDIAQRQKLKDQDFLYTLIELDPTGKSAEVSASILDYVPIEADNAALIAAMAQPNIRIVSLTVTEGGYYLSADDGQFDAVHEDIVHDLNNPQSPRTVFASMIQALRIRRDNGLGPFTCMSCDNLQGNGDILKDTLLSLATLIEPPLAQWIETHCSFPNSMVDCIVPATGPSELALAKSFGVADACPVTHENFRQWVIQDDFCAGRPPLEVVGVTFSSDVSLYENMKLRILNGGHQIIAMPGALLGIETIDMAMADPQISAFLHKVVSEEIAPHVKAVPGMDALDYLALVERRFSNPEIKDTTRRVAFDGSARQPGFILPVIWDGLREGVPVDGLALVTALWCRYCEGRYEDGTTIEPNDPNWDVLQQNALDAHDDPLAWLRQNPVYSDLAAYPAFATAFCHWHQVIILQGVEKALAEFLADDAAGLDSITG